MNNTETIVLIAVILLALFVIFHPIFTDGTTSSAEGFTARQQMSTNDSELNLETQIETGDKPSNRTRTFRGQADSNGSWNYLRDVNMYDPNEDMNGGLTPKGDSKNYESLIYDNVTRTIMTGSQFMENTGIIAPPWVAPAWDPDAYGPSSKGVIDPTDYENDTRMLYNKCSLSCCSPQYPTPFQGDSDPFVCDKDGKSKYLASSFICTNNTGGTGCLCMTPKQVSNAQSGYLEDK